MGAKVLTMFLSRLAKDFSQWRSGMPDLILWKEARPPNNLKSRHQSQSTQAQREYLTESGAGGIVKFVEVKSEFDTLSEQ